MHNSMKYIFYLFIFKILISLFSLFIYFLQKHKRWNAALAIRSSTNITTILFQLLVVINFSVFSVHGKLNLCDVETGQTNIILDIEESRGDCKYMQIAVYTIKQISLLLSCSNKQPTTFSSTHKCKFLFILFSLSLFHSISRNDLT